MDTIFTVRNEDLARLNPAEAVEFFRELLWAEARSKGIAVSKVHISTSINVPDGGIDALVEETDGRAGNGLIQIGQTAYQIKTGKNFEPWRDAEIKKELFGDKPPARDNLGASVRDCLDKSGKYVLVCFKLDLVEPQRKESIEIVVAYLSQCGYKNPAVEVWSQGHLLGFLRVFPSLCLGLTGRGAARFQTHKMWASEAEMKRDFQAGQKQSELIRKLGDDLRTNDEAIHVRVWGDAGMGKTRLVLEATRDNDLGPLVVYCDSAAKFRDSDLMNEILRDDNLFNAILVIDECDPDSRSYIWNKLKFSGPRIKLVTLYNEYDETSGPISYVDIIPLDKEQISNIIQTYSVPKDHADRWADLCSGSPRMAHVIGWNLINNPEDLLKSPDTVNVWDRYVVAGDDPQSDNVRERRIVLRHIALFKRFGFNHPLTQEARCIASIVQQAAPSITWPRFQEIIHSLKARKILQGEITLYITPKGLHIKLWIEWWNTYGNGFDFGEFSKQLSPQLLEWFYEMFKYAAESEVAQETVRALLGKDGPFQQSEYLTTKLGARFFLALAEADPKSALKCLENTIGTWSKNDLVRFDTGRREVVWALERIAMWRDLFSGAARILLVLAEAENETYSNNASGVFTELFSPAPSPVAPTEASPEERFPILIEALDSSSKEKRLLGLEACKEAVETRNFGRMIGAEHQGLRKEPQLWKPKTYGEMFDAYRRVWQELHGRLDRLPADEQARASQILINKSRGLISYQNLASMVIHTLTALTDKGFIDKKQLLAKIIEILHYDGKDLPPATRQDLEKLKERLTGSDFSSLLKRYAGMELLEDKFDEAGNQINQTEPRLQALAQQIVENNELIRPELGWLVTTEAQNGFVFGYELGKRDIGFALLPKLIDAQRNAAEKASAFFLGGYLRVIYEDERERWENTLDSLAEDEHLRALVPELAWRSGPLTDRAGMRMLNLAEKGYITVGHFRLFAYGSATNNLSDDVFRKWLEFLVSSQDKSAASVSLTLCDYYYLEKASGRSLPEELSFKLLTHDTLFQKGSAQLGQMDDYHWTRVGKAFVHLYPEKSLELAEKILEHFGEEGTIIGGFHSSTHAVLNEIARLRSKETWVLVTKYIGPPIDSRAFRICLWLRGGEFFAEAAGALTMMPRDKIWEWVNENVEKRAWLVAHIAPKTTSLDNWSSSLAREILVRYGNRKDVRGELRANYSTEGWSGPESMHYQAKKLTLLQFNDVETNDNVKQWLNEYISILDGDIKRAQIEEERAV
jgi:hypothetical protein